MKITLVAVGKLKEPAWRTLMDDYVGRIRRYVPIDEIEVKNDAALERGLPAGALRIALEVNGEQLSSAGLARRLERWGSQGKGELVFFIGGAEGIPRALSGRADAKLSLSTLTLPHRMARVLLAEQIYRGFSILRNEPYAREG